jgi:hypothetical protein
MKGMGKGKQFKSILIFLLFAISCSHSSNHPVELSGKEDALKVNEFKKWLRDTLQTLNRKTEGTEVIVGDSESLTLRFHYNFTIDKPADADTNDLAIDLLKQYNEIPKGKFILNYIRKEYYRPSYAEGLIYECTTDVPQLEVKDLTNNALISYSYIRGRLSGKVTNRNQQAKESEFIWLDDSLIKRDINSMPSGIKNKKG